MSLEFRARQQDLIAQINELIFYTSAEFFFPPSATRRLELKGESSKLRKRKENGREIRALDVNSSNVIQRQ